ncbi:phage major capsid protein [Rossellomorea yichunensis]|uniref:phage major capsid protein n=1 Tax=Rossellomorea yichunensis TaxID=3077331 RepID=UPI0028DDBDEC|nr:phage major capsid protein [Rossellomorea sp. YC4-1]MDT9027882.1 phage major capsid protein [Rossellomorea sp. YC4-1]
MTEVKHQIELRVQDVNLVSEDEKGMIVSGYVNKTEEFSQVLGVSKRFKEKIAKGAFAQAIKCRETDVDFLLEHNPKHILASTRNNSLILEEDSIGLKMTAKIVGTSWGKDSFELIKSGILQNMSFGFRVLNDTWKQIGGIYERTVNSLELFEVSVVKNPAYASSSIAARSIEINNDPVIRNLELEDETLNRIQRLRIQIERQKDEVRQAEETLKIKPESEAFKELVVKKAADLTNFEQELRDLTKDLQHKMEENQMTTENRTLQGQAEGTSTAGNKQSQIVELLENESKVFKRAKKLSAKGVSEFNIPVQTDLDDALFVAEEGNLPEAELKLDKFATMTQKRVGISEQMSRKLAHDSGVDLIRFERQKLVKRVARAIESSILAGSSADEFCGIAPDTNVPSENVGIDPTNLQLRQVMLAVHEDYAQNGIWYMSRSFFEKVAVLQNGNGDHYVKYIEVNGKVKPHLYGHPIEISTALGNGDTIGQVPVIFANIEEAYTVAVWSDNEDKEVDVDTVSALSGKVRILAEAYVDGHVTNYQAVSKGTVS